MACPLAPTAAAAVACSGLAVPRSHRADGKAVARPLHRHCPAGRRHSYWWLPDRLPLLRCLPPRPLGLVAPCSGRRHTDRARCGEVDAGIGWQHPAAASFNIRGARLGRSTNAQRRTSLPRDPESLARRRSPDENNHQQALPLVLPGAAASPYMQRARTAIYRYMRPTPAVLLPVYAVSGYRARLHRVLAALTALAVFTWPNCWLAIGRRC